MNFAPKTLPKVTTPGAYDIEQTRGTRYIKNSQSNNYCATCDQFFGAYKFQELQYSLAETLESSWTWCQFKPGSYCRIWNLDRTYCWSYEDHDEGYDYTDRKRYYSRGTTWETRNQPIDRSQVSICIRQSRDKAGIALDCGRYI